MNPQVDLFYENAPRWQQEMLYLRTIVLDCNLVEEYKWRGPIYCHNNANILAVNAFKESCVLSFFKGTLLSDHAGILTAPSENSQEFRYIKFTSVDQIAAIEQTIKTYIYEAVEVQKAGLKVPVVKPEDLTLPVELIQIFDTDHQFKAAFESLTPGRQKAYIYHFSEAKQPATRIARIEKFMPRIILGKGLTDCVCGLTHKKPSCDGSHKLKIPHSTL